MRVCPTCNHQYADGDGNFCVRDGTALVAPTQAPSTQAPSRQAPSTHAPSGPAAIQTAPGQAAGPPRQPVSQPGTVPPAAHEFGAQMTGHPQADQSAGTAQAAGQHRVQPGAVAGAPLERIKCDWCQGTNESAALACRYCGAPLDVKNLVSDSG